MKTHFFEHAITICLSLGFALSGFNGIHTTIESRQDFVHRPKTALAQFTNDIKISIKTRLCVFAFRVRCVCCDCALTSRSPGRSGGVLALNTSVRRWNRSSTRLDGSWWRLLFRILHQQRKALHIGRTHIVVIVALRVGVHGETS